MNSIIWNNAGGSQVSGTAPTITYSLVQGDFTGEGNLDVDPLFAAPSAPDQAPTTAGNYRLLYNSPAIDTGNNGAVTATTNLDGNPRLADDNLDGDFEVDRGAYERQAFKLTIETVGDGSVSLDPDQFTYGYFEQVTLTANANAGWKFAGWSGDATGTDNPLTVTIQGDTTIICTFIKDTKYIYLPLVKH